MDAPCSGAKCVRMEVLLTPARGTSMSEITVIGLDLGKTGLPGTRSRQRGSTGVAQASSARPGSEFFCQPVTLFDRAGGLCRVALLGARAAGTGPWGSSNPAAIRETLCQDEQERRH